MNITMKENARRVKLNARLAKSFWAKTVYYACFITNRSPSTTINFKVPDEVL